jgi:hypothetical protein
MRWLEDMEKGLLKIKVKIWRQKAVDREQWALIIKEAKAVRETYNQEVCK